MRFVLTAMMISSVFLLNHTSYASELSGHPTKIKSRFDQFESKNIFSFSLDCAPSSSGFLSGLVKDSQELKKSVKKIENKINENFAQLKAEIASLKHELNYQACEIISSLKIASGSPRPSCMKPIDTNVGGGIPNDRPDITQECGTFQNNLFSVSSDDANYSAIVAMINTAVISGKEVTISYDDDSLTRGHSAHINEIIIQ